MNPIEECYASAVGTYIDTIEGVEQGSSLSHFYCTGFIDRTFIDENGRTFTCKAMNMDVGQPKDDNSAFQNMILQLDNNFGEVQEIVEAARERGDRFIVTARRYLVADLTAPAVVYRSTLLSREYEEGIAKLTCGFFDLLNTNGLRGVLTTDRAPGLTYT